MERRKDRGPPRDGEPAPASGADEPIREGDVVHALISISFFTTALAKCEIADKVIAPLRATTRMMEEAVAAVHAGGLAGHAAAGLEPAF